MENRNRELNERLLTVCTADVIDFDLAEKLLKQGAEPLGTVEGEYGKNNLYGEVAEKHFGYEETTEAFYLITKLFLDYGMDIRHPSVPYDYSYVFHPLSYYNFQTNEWGIRTLQLFLENDCSAEDAREFWHYALGDFRYCPTSLSEDIEYQFHSDFIRKLMLVASYPHILNADDELRKLIWFEYNHYDLMNFRNWNDYAFEVDTSFCEDVHFPEEYRSITTIIEKNSGKAVWKLGIGILPVELGTEE